MLAKALQSEPINCTDVFPNDVKNREEVPEIIQLRKIQYLCFRIILSAADPCEQFSLWRSTVLSTLKKRRRRVPRSHTSTNPPGM